MAMMKGGTYVQGNREDSAGRKHTFLGTSRNKVKRYRGQGR